MLLAPSDIQFLRDGAANLTDADSDTLAELSKEFAAASHLPKLQVTGKDGAWFALNNSSLHVVRELERQGKCGRVKVDVVPLSKVPTSVQRGMIPESQTQVEDKTTDPSRETKRGYEKLPDRTIEDSSNVPVSVSVEEESTSCTSSDDCSDCSEDMSESDDGDEDLTCNVCDRSFASSRLLAQHQQKKRHFGCSVCESLFPSLMALEHHKECLDHWSEDEGNSQDSDDDDDNEVVAVKAGKGEDEMERLL